ncbi:MAG: hypothetical protein ACE5GC_04410 [Acidimicrobiia bacterium]
MRGVSYAITEIGAFMLAATLVGYLIGRTAAPRRVVHDPARDDASRGELLAAATRRAETVASENARLVSAYVEIEGELQDAVSKADGAVGDQFAEIEALRREIERQRAIIAGLEEGPGVPVDVSDELIQRDSRIADLVAALDAAREPARAAVYTASASGSGSFADARIDFQILD